MGKRRGRSLATRLAACAVIGALLTVVVAWALAVLPPLTTPASNEGSSRVAVSSMDGVPRLQMVMVDFALGWCSVSLPAPIEGQHGWFKLQDWRTPLEDVVPRWGRRYADAPPRGLEPARQFVGFGLPFHSLHSASVISFRSAQKWDVRWGRDIVLPWIRQSPPGSTVPGPAILPCHLIVRGFALDTALYAAIALTLWSAPAAIRRRIRRARGHCPACGYNLQGAPTPTCPECGA